MPIPRFLINDIAEHVRDKSRDDLVFTGVRSGTALRAASLAVASGANVKVVQQMLGHKSATVTSTSTATYSATI